jgi:hypothetical protein
MAHCSKRWGRGCKRARSLSFSIAFTEDDTRVAYITVEGKVCIYETSTGIEIATLPSDIAVTEPEPLRISFSCGFWDMSTYLTYSMSGAHKNVHIFTVTESGWLLHSRSGYKQRQICWLPLERRCDDEQWYKMIESTGTRVIIGGTTGIVTILECGPAIALFDDLENADMA